MQDLGVEADSGHADWQGALPETTGADKRAPILQLRLPAAATRPSALPADIAFLAAEGIDPVRLAQAAARARLLGVPAHRCLIASGLIGESDYILRLGQRLGAPVVRQARLDARVGLDQALRQGWCRAVTAEGAPVMLCRLGGPLVPALLAGSLAGARGHLALASDADYQAIVLRHFAGTVAEFAAQTVAEDRSARAGASEAQKLWPALMGLALLPVLVHWPDLLLVLLPLLLGQVFLAATIVQIAACFVGLPDRRLPVERVDARLPDYSVLVPLYCEGNIVADLITALLRLDYPAEKLQILLVTEADDHETQAAIRAIALPSHIRLFVAPPGQPRTKPRALNAAMPFVTGSLLVVYDAEDRPEPQQLRAAAAHLAACGPDVACLQARLAIDNISDSWLTRLFTLEYAALFDIVKAGQARMDLPVPLGGTSNHFRTDVLRAVGCWDAWNVTEDADLGIRLAACGYRVEDLNATTHEEAPVTLAAWMHQRARWLKGWMQTVVTHTRRPLATLRAMGPMNAFAALAGSLGIVIGIAFAPLFHGLALWRIGSGQFLDGASLLDAAADALVLVLGTAGLLATVVPTVLGALKRRRADLLPWLVLLPVYHLLMAVAAWRAAYDFVRDPHGWNKTTHGLARSRAAGRPDQKQ